MVAAPSAACWQGRVQILKQIYHKA
jgi:hypothetical protein